MPELPEITTTVKEEPVEVQPELPKADGPPTGHDGPGIADRGTARRTPDAVGTSEVGEHQASARPRRHRGDADPREGCGALQTEQDNAAKKALRSKKPGTILKVKYADRLAKRDEEMKKAFEAAAASPGSAEAGGPVRPGSSESDPFQSLLLRQGGRGFSSPVPRGSHAQDLTPPYRRYGARPQRDIGFISCRAS